MLIALTLAAVLTAPAQASPPEPPRLTMAQAVRQARSASPLREPSRRLTEGSADALRLFNSWLNPTLDVRVENLGTAARSLLPRDVFALASQPIEIAGKRGLRLGIATADRDVALANLAAADWQVSLQTVQFYVQALKARGLLETLAANREGLATLIEVMRRRVTEGYSAESDLLKFETESARVDIEVARASLDLQRCLGALTYVIGATAMVVPAQLVEPEPAAPPRLEGEALVSAVARQPEVLAALARADRARQIAALERARRVPDPIFTAGYKRTSGFDTAVVGVTIAMPVFDRNASAAARAVGEARAVEADQVAVARRLAADAATLIATAQTLSDRSARAPRELLEPAETVRSAARAAFREGAVDVLKLIDAERVYGDVRRAALELRLEALTATLEARLAIGEEILP